MCLLYIVGYAGYCVAPRIFGSSIVTYFSVTGCYKFSHCGIIFEISPLQQKCPSSVKPCIVSCFGPGMHLALCVTVRLILVVPGKYYVLECQGPHKPPQCSIQCDGLFSFTHILLGPTQNLSISLPTPGVEQLWFL